MIKVIPAIDIIEGKCVRLSQGDYSKMKVYHHAPLETAKEFESMGFSHLHLVDLDGAKAKHIVNWKVLEEISNKTRLNIDFGGGLKSNEDIEKAFNCGASQITAGSIAVINPEIVYGWIEKYGSNKIILGADISGNKIAINGWLNKTGVEIWDHLAHFVANKIKYCICTDISKDGMLEGINTQLYKELNVYFPELKMIASGGVSSIQDIDGLNNLGLYGVIVGKALYENRITCSEIQKYL